MAETGWPEPLMALGCQLGCVEVPPLTLAPRPGAAEYFQDRTDVQCLHRWQKVLNPDLVKGPWTKEVRSHHAPHRTVARRVR